MHNPLPDAGEPIQLAQEVADLKRQVLALSQQVKDMARYFDVQPADPALGIPQKVVVRCTDFSVFHRRDKGIERQIIMHAGEHGPSITLYGSDDHPRIALRADKEGTQLELFAKNWGTAVRLEADESSGRGLVGVLEAGKTRAAIKAGDGEGVVTVVHDDGRARAWMRGNAERGDISLISSETQAALSLYSGPGGGGLRINDNSGTRQATLAATPVGGQLLLYNDLGIQRAHLGSASDAAALTLNWGGHNGVFLAAAETGGLLDFLDAEGNIIAKLPESRNEGS